MGLDVSMEYLSWEGGRTNPQNSYKPSFKSIKSNNVTENYIRQAISEIFSNRHRHPVTYKTPYLALYLNLKKKRNKFCSSGHFFQVQTSRG